MVIKQEVAYGIIEAITDLRKGDDLEDFTVIVDGISVRCHRFILGACSLFFRGMFRSGMKEVEENCGHLKSVSHPTFTLILSALYTGCDILTEENVIEIWNATHMLRIKFLVRECEALLEQIISLENYEEIYENAKLLDSKRILKAEHNFMAQNFDNIRTSKTFLNLSFSELNALIKTDELVTKSEDKVVESIFQWTSYTPPTAEEEADNNSECCIEGQAVQNDDNQEKEAVTGVLNKEDTVNTIHGNNESSTKKLNNETEVSGNHKEENETAFANENVSQDTKTQDCLQDKMMPSRGEVHRDLSPAHKQTQTAVLSEERQQYLLSLISNSRHCLLSPEYLEELLSNPTIVDSPGIRGVLFKAFCYQLQARHRHGQWPSGAVYRSKSDVKNVLIWTRLGSYYGRVRSANKIFARSFFSEMLTLELTFKSTTGRLTAFDNNLYELVQDGLHVFRDDSWTRIFSCKLSDQTFMISLGNFIYFLDGNDSKLTSVDPNATKKVLQTHSNFPGGFDIAGAAKYQDKIIAFSSNASEENEIETIVHIFNPHTDGWKRLENLKGPAQDIISFNKDENTFLLQTNGNLWNVTDDGNGSLNIMLSMKAWDFHWELHGAAICREKLLIFGGKLPEEKSVSFSLPGCFQKVVYYTAGVRGCAVPIILPSKYLKNQE